MSHKPSPPIHPLASTRLNHQSWISCPSLIPSPAHLLPAAVCLPAAARNPTALCLLTVATIIPVQVQTIMTQRRPKAPSSIHGVPLPLELFLTKLPTEPGPAKDTGQMHRKAASCLQIPLKSL